MKNFIIVLNIILVIMIPVVFTITPVNDLEKSMIKTDVEIKKLESGLLKQINNSDKKEDADQVSLEEEIDSKEDIKENDKKSIINDNIVIQKKEVETLPKEEVVIEDKAVKTNGDVLEVQTGKMSGYGPDCRGCSGYLSSGKYVGDGNIYYNDKTYGQVRILAGDYSYKFGTIVRIKNSKAGNNIIGIVLDRGGSIGIGKKFLFDLLYPTESDALKDEVSYNVEFEILRYGY